MRNALCLLALVAAANLNAANATETHAVNSLSYQSAAKALESCLKEAKKMDRNVAIVVLDANGDIIASARMDSAKAAAHTLAIKKAKTALLFRGSSRTAMEEINKGATALLSLEDLAALPGGLALNQGGEFIGAIGVSGAPADIDEAIATSGLEELKD